MSEPDKIELVTDETLDQWYEEASTWPFRGTVHDKLLELIDALRAVRQESDKYKAAGEELIDNLFNANKRIAELEQKLAILRNFEMNDGTKIDLTDINRMISIIAYRGKCWGMEQQAQRDRERISELEDSLKASRVVSRLHGIEEGCALYEETLRKIGQLSTGWKHGQEGIHLLRINEEASAALAKEPNEKL
jgi:hypothetical protein